MRDTELLLGVTGSIAAYKALELVRLFRHQGWGVTVVMTRSAAKLIGIDSFRTLTGRPVALELFPRHRPDRSALEHIDLATRPDLLLIAPATANIIGKLSAGIADDLLSTLLLAVPAEKIQHGRVIFAPAMNVHMWENPVVQANVKKLQNLGYRFIPPGTGELACGATGAGRMANPEEILSVCRTALAALPDLSGIKVLVTMGRTEEPLDPVRIITNRSSGRMGLEIFRAFKAAGANTRLISGAVSVPLPETALRVTTTREMAQAVLQALPETDILIMCAAVADYEPRQVAREKRHADRLEIELVRTPDILKLVAAQKKKPFLVGFSLDTSIARAEVKQRTKKLDLVVANPVSTAGAETIRATLLDKSGKRERLPELTKADFALKLVKKVAQIYRKGG